MIEYQNKIRFRRIRQHVRSLETDGRQEVDRAKKDSVADDLHVSRRLETMKLSNMMVYLKKFKIDV